MLIFKKCFIRNTLKLKLIFVDFLFESIKIRDSLYYINLKTLTQSSMFVMYISYKQFVYAQESWALSAIRLQSGI